MIFLSKPWKFRAISTPAEALQKIPANKKATRSFKMAMCTSWMVFLAHHDWQMERPCIAELRLAFLGEDGRSTAFIHERSVFSGTARFLATPSEFLTFFIMDNSHSVI